LHEEGKGRREGGGKGGGRVLDSCFLSPDRRVIMIGDEGGGGREGARSCSSILSLDRQICEQSEEAVRTKF
jgi:hypothetical protein